MDKKTIAIAALICWCFGCTTGTTQSGSDYSPTASPSVATNMTNPGESADLVFDPVAVDSLALPELRDLPFPASLKSRERPRKYTGIIKNKTKYAVSVPSANSGATLDIPAHSWIEFTTWTRKSDVTVYRDGKPFYCLKLCADPCEYPFMCKKYDFMAEIVKEEPVIKGPSKLKPRKRFKRRG
jgi:hypothetical protein